MNWPESTGRVILEACNPDPQDIAFVLGWSPIVDELARAVAEVPLVTQGC